MKKQMMVRSGVAGAIAATGLVVGGIAVASADDQAPAEQGTSQDQAEKSPRDGRGGPGARGPAADAAALADALGVSEADLTAAMDAIRESGDDATDGERPDPQQRQSDMAAALAEELGLSEDEVTAAQEKVRESAAADRRTELSDRLDTAVGDGDLTDGDAASVLKAYDAGVLGGPGPR